MSGKIVALGDSILEELLKRTFTSDYRTGYVKAKGFVMVNSYSKFSQVIDDFEVRDDDVWICSFPRSGTTWTQEMVWCIANDLDFERAKTSLDHRSPYFEFSYTFDSTEMLRRNDIPEHMRASFTFIEKLASPRFIKTHLPFNLLPREIRTGEKKPKIVYVTRDAKDTCISYFHMMQYLSGFKGDFNDFCTLFLGDTMHHAPFWGHVLSYWGKRRENNMLILKYDDMKKDLPSEIKRTAEFLGKGLTDDQVAALAEHLSFENMKGNTAVNNEKFVADGRKVSQVKREGAFMRCGKSEQWRTVMSTDVIKQFNDWTERNLKDTDFPY